MLLRSTSKLIFLALFAATAAAPLAAFAQAYKNPGAPVGYVNDFASVIPAAQRSSLETKLSGFERSTGVQIAVATVPSLGGDTIEDYASHLFKDWGIGNKDKDNGLLILVAPNERQARIEVGYGLEGTVTDLQAGAIVRQAMIPAFKQGDYAGGISAAADAVIGIVTGSSDASVYSQPMGGVNDGTDGNVSSNENWVAVFFAAMIFLNVLARWFGRTKSWWLGGVVGGLIGLIPALIWGFVPVGAISIPGLIILGLIFDYFVSKHPPGSGPGGTSGGVWPFLMFFGGRGGKGSGGFGGGFGGFGGGMSGGGGASGRW